MDTLKNKVNLNALTGSKIVSVIGILFVIISIILISLWLYGVLHKDKKNCSNMKSIYTDFPKITNIDLTNKDKSCHSLRDYYIKTAYNCCSAGNYKNDYVNVCALKECIRQGVRCLDFQIFSIDNKPVIAVSTQKDFFIKESWNYISFSQAMDIVANYAFSGGTCPNPRDPLILHFRIMSNNVNIYDTMASSIKGSFKSQSLLLDPKFSFESNGINLGAIPIVNLMGKVIIIVDKTNPLFEGTSLDEYVNISSNSIFMRSLQYHDVRYTPDMNELINFNKKNMTICLPDLGEYPINPSAPLAMNYGCQMVAMCFQNNDSNLSFYNDEFNSNNSAFIVKPMNLRYIPVNAPIPPPPAENLSYKSRDVSSDFYAFQV